MASLSTRTARGILAKEGKNATGNLSASIQHKVVQDKDGNTNVVWDMAGAPYWVFVEKGVKVPCRMLRHRTRHSSLVQVAGRRAHYNPPSGNGL